MNTSLIKARCRRALLLFLTVLIAVTGLGIAGANPASAKSFRNPGGYCPDLMRIDGNVGDAWRTSKTIKYWISCYATYPDEKLLYSVDVLGTKKFANGPQCGPVNTGYSKVKWFGSVVEDWYPNVPITADSCGQRRDWLVRFNVARFKYCPCSKTWKQIASYNFGYETFAVGRNSSSLTDLTPGAPDAYPSPPELTTMTATSIGMPPPSFPDELFDPAPPGM